MTQFDGDDRYDRYVGYVTYEEPEWNPVNFFLKVRRSHATTLRRRTFLRIKKMATDSSFRVPVVPVVPVV